MHCHLMQGSGLGVNTGPMDANDPSDDAYSENGLAGWTTPPSAFTATVP